MIRDLINGNEEMIQPIIKEYIPMAKKIGNYYKMKYVSQDVMSESYLGLCQGVTWACEGRVKEVAHFEGYIALTIKNVILRSRREDQLIYVDYRKNTAESVRCFATDKRLDKSTSVDYDGEIDLNNFVDRMCLSFAQRKILSMKLDGYGSKEIQKELGMSKTTLYRNIERIRERILTTSNYWEIDFYET